ncbi:MAG: sulfatase-like hydrolase/transferase [Phycisphaerae bacterium]|nr:sulfatase-like hydrolase/transferase [Phycisphaerae bacterium]
MTTRYKDDATHDALTRRSFLGTLATGAASLAIADDRLADQAAARPNVILCMADDQGWGDTGYNGHPILETPNLDAMSRQGIRFNRFYSGAPVCSPTRGSCLTGRHPYRYGIFNANVGHMPKQEITLAEALRTQGYATGHFGKWHLGTLSKTVKDSNRGGPRGVEHYAPPWENGFDVCFSTEAKVPTYNPMITPDRWSKGKAGRPFGTYYWSGPDRRVTENLDGDDSRIIMDRAIPFIEQAATRRKPFLAVIWFHAPHLPVVAGPKHRALYKDQPVGAQHYFGCITAMDEQIGRLRAKLADLGIDKNSMLWFCSDNGPEGPRHTDTNGSAGPLRGRKRSLFEGGVRVPGLLIWPEKVRTPRVVDMPCGTSDYFPTVMDALGFRLKGRPEPVDGVSLMPVIEGKMTSRPTPIGFESGKQVSLTDNRFKLISQDAGKTFMLFDLLKDEGEKQDLAASNPEIVRKMRQTLDEWRASCKRSRSGADYR